MNDLLDDKRALVSGRSVGTERPLLAVLFAKRTNLIKLVSILQRKFRSVVNILTYCPKIARTLISVDLLANQGWLGHQGDRMRLSGE